MGLLQQCFEDIFAQHFTGTLVIEGMLRRVLERKKITLTDEQLEDVTQRIMAAKGHHVSFELDVPGPEREINISEKDIAQSYNALESDIEDILQSTVLAVVKDVGPKLLRGFRSHFTPALSESRQSRVLFRSALETRWGSVLDLLEVIIRVAKEAWDTQISETNEEKASESKATDTHDDLVQESSVEPTADSLLWQAVAAIHARACRIAEEITLLLSAGFADGANSRWRSLHELAVVAMFLVERRGDVPERFLCHDAIQSYAQACEYQRHYEALGFEPVSKDEMAAMKEERDSMVARFGKDYRLHYGWAANALNIPKPSFADIERSLHMSHWRPFYRAACHSIHTASKTLFHEPENYDGDETFVLRGAINSGLSGPAISTAQSLAMVTVALMTVDANIDRLAMCEVMRLLGEELSEAAEAIEEEFNANRALTEVCH